MTDRMNSRISRQRSRRNRRQFLHTVPVALASASGAFGAITSFASFMPGWGGGSLQYQDSKFRMGVLHILAGHSGPETAADARTHFGIFSPQVWKLFPRNQTIHLSFWDYNDVAPGYFAAAEIAARGDGLEDPKAPKAGQVQAIPRRLFDTQLAAGFLGQSTPSLVSLLQANAVPMPVERARIAPPRCRMGALTPDERAQVIARSPIGAKYNTPINRESAFEVTVQVFTTQRSAASSSRASRNPFFSKASNTSCVSYWLTLQPRVTSRHVF